MWDDEEELYKRFQSRLQNLKKRAQLRGAQTIDEKALEEKVFKSYDNGFRCEYCNREMKITTPKKPYSEVFSLDHKIPLDQGGQNTVENIAIVCLRCNIVKSTMLYQTYLQLIEPHINNHNFLDQIHRELNRGRTSYTLERDEVAAQQNPSHMTPRCPKCDIPLSQFIKFKADEPDLICLNCDGKYRLVKI